MIVPNSATPVPATVIEVAGGVACVKCDQLAAEEPLAVQIGFGAIRARRRETISVTMRTPGHDADLAVGLLFAEGVVTHPEQILAIDTGLNENSVRIQLHPAVAVDLARLDRRGYTSSSCGVCGKTSIESLEAMCEGPRSIGAPVGAAVIHVLPAALLASQQLFATTGGLHAAALFQTSGTLLSVREDVGRHNAVDKLIGAEFLAGRIPLQDRILLVSGRAGFELIQKGAMAGVPIFAAVGAPTSLAVLLAQQLGVTLLGFVRDDHFNIYTGAERIAV